MHVVFIHGWSVTNTDTYGGLPSALARNTPPGMDITIQHLYLAKYISFSDEVSMDDIARGMQNAVVTEVMPKLGKGERFACVTHSTGGPVVRTWMDLYYREKALPNARWITSVMLAPANHGSALAQLGKSRLARMKFFAEGVQPGTGVLDWLELGSDQSWALNAAWLDYDCLGAGIYAFVLVGQNDLNRNFYDNLNLYTGEAGSGRRGTCRGCQHELRVAPFNGAKGDGGFELSKDGRTQQSWPGSLARAIPLPEPRSESCGSVAADDNGIASHRALADSLPECR